MNRGLSTLFVAASLIVLAGCRISFEPPFPDAPDFQVSNDPAAIITSANLAPNEDVVYRMNLSSSQMSSQAVYFEIDNDLDLYVYRSSGGLLATSSSDLFFAEGTLGLQSASLDAAGVEPLAVRANVACEGSCVIADANSSTFFVRIHNTTGTTAGFTLYSFVDRYEDDGEFENDSTSGAVTIPATPDSAEGAIESLGDVDYFSPVANGDMTFDHSATVDIQAVVIDTITGDRIPVTRGVPISVFADDFIEVRVSGDDEAATSGRSIYFLTLVPN